MEIYEYFKQQLTMISDERNYHIHPQIVDYISEIITTNYKGIPFYIIDIKANTRFQLYKRRGDISLILVGFFTEWLNRIKRPLKEKDYIFTGKLNYRNAYEYLEANYKEIQFKEIPLEEKILSFSDIFYEMSENFEYYADLLKSIRKKMKENYEIYKMYNNQEKF